MADRIRRLGLDGRVHLLGEREDVSEIMPGFDIATTASAWGEAFPNVIGEAMACGVPCVVTDVGDSAQVVGETGVVVPPKDPAALADGWASFIRMAPSDREKLGTSSRKRIADRYSLPQITREYEAVYKDAVDS
jgi:glycosyltransferase involved in cell wall biosynthesis